MKIKKTFDLSLTLSITYCLFFLLQSCATTPERQLSKIEMKKLGLNGILYDALYCKSRLGSNNKTITSGPCELVTCNSTGKDLICFARQTDRLPGQPSK